ncbi:MAG: hypothetical protein MZU95_00035 [Desulfomicrobium escambiense]|nr:hypothetical protein [Desulfomicrobium escambiense]
MPHISASLPSALKIRKVKSVSLSVIQDDDPIGTYAGLHGAGSDCKGRPVEMKQGLLHCSTMMKSFPAPAILAKGIPASHLLSITMTSFAPW